MKKIMIIGIIMLVTLSIVSNVISISTKNEVKNNKKLELLNDPPVVWHELDPPEPTGKNGWYIGPVTLSLFAEDEDGIKAIYHKEGCTWMPYFRPMKLDFDGELVIYFYAVDLEGEESEIETINIAIDQKPPEIELTKNRTSLTEITFTAESYDGESDIDFVELYVDDVLYDSAQGGDLHDFNWKGIGKHQVKAIAYDKAGWVTESDTLYTTKSRNIARIFDHFPILSRLFNL